MPYATFCCRQVCLLLSSVLVMLLSTVLVMLLSSVLVMLLSTVLVVYTSSFKGSIIQEMETRLTDIKHGNNHVW